MSTSRARKRKTRNKGKTSKLKRMLFGGLFFIVLIVLFYVFFLSGWLSVADVSVEVKNSEYIAKNDIQKIVQKNLSSSWLYNLPLASGFIVPKNIILISNNQIVEDIIDSLPEIKTAKTDKNILQKKLKIIAVEREKFGIWCDADYIENKKISTSSDRVINSTTATTTNSVLERQVNQCFYISQEGVAYKKAPPIKGSLVNNLYSSWEGQELRNQVIPVKIINFIKSLKKKLKDFRFISFDLISRETLKAETSDGWYINFNPTYSLDSQIDNLQLLLKKEIGDTFDLEYIDLRTEGRGYYK